MSKFLDHRSIGLSLYADQLGMTTSEVESYFLKNYGSEFSEAAFAATGSGVWEENHLNLRERSLLVISILAAIGGVESRLEGHFKWAIKHGATIEDIRSALLLVANYAGFARASSALDILNRVI